MNTKPLPEEDVPAAGPKAASFSDRTAASASRFPASVRAFGAERLKKVTMSLDLS